MFASAAFLYTTTLLPPLRSRDSKDGKKCGLAWSVRLPLILKVPGQLFENSLSLRSSKIFDISVVYSLELLLSVRISILTFIASPIYPLIIHCCKFRLLHKVYR